jgi:hypothetical protein
MSVSRGKDHSAGRPKGTVRMVNGAESDLVAADGKLISYQQRREGLRPWTALDRVPTGGLVHLRNRPSR